MNILQETNSHGSNRIIVEIVKPILILIVTIMISEEAFSSSNIDTRVSMSDGVSLMTKVYLPAETGAFPTVLIRTPYSGAWLERVATRFTTSGYATVIQDVRGKSESEGEFTPFANEGSDGSATLDWVTGQEWSDGRVVIWGVSYLSFCGFEVAREQNTSVKAMVNISGWADLNSFITRGGALRLADLLPWVMAYAAGQSQIPDQAWNSIFRTTPLSQFFPDPDGEVGAAMSTPYDFSRIDIPALHITGWNDFICRNTLEAFHNAKSSGSENPSSKLIIGPWTHNQIFDPDSSKYGDADFGSSSLMGLDSVLALSVIWFDEHLKETSDGSAQLPNVTYFTQNSNQWHTAEDWPPRNAFKEVWHLTSHSGSAILQPSLPSDESSLEYIYNPEDPVPTIGGPISYKRPFNVGVKDQSSLKNREDILFFESNVLKKPLELAGPISVVLFASTDSVDTDFTAKLVELRDDGYARMIEDGIIRARYLDGSDSAKLVSPNTVVRYEIDLGETAYRFAAGSKLRLEISSGNFPKFDRNPNNGVEPFEATQFRTARQRIVMSKDHPSRLILTVVDRSS